jgi:hypothetical protein
MRCRDITLESRSRLENVQKVEHERNQPATRDSGTSYGYVGPASEDIVHQQVL